MTLARRTELDARSMMTQEERFFAARADTASNATVAAYVSASVEARRTGRSVYEIYDDKVAKLWANKAVLQGLWVLCAAGLMSHFTLAGLL